MCRRIWDRKKNPRNKKPIKFGGKGENQMPEAGKKVPCILSEHLQGPWKVSANGKPWKCCRGIDDSFVMAAIRPGDDMRGKILEKTTQVEEKGRFCHGVAKNYYDLKRYLNIRAVFRWKKWVSVVVHIKLLR